MVLNIILIYYTGALGAACATMIGYFTTWLLRTLKILKIVRMKVRWKNHIISCLLLFVQAVLALKQGTELAQIVIFILIVSSQRYFFKIFLKNIKN